MRKPAGGRAGGPEGMPPVAAAGRVEVLPAAARAEPLPAADCAAPVHAAGGMEEGAGPEPGAGAAELRGRLARLAAALEACYGRPPAPAAGDAADAAADADPLDALVKTLLSQATSDLNSDRAYATLRARFPTWGAALEAPVADVASAIAGGGLGPTKAARIRAILERLAGERGRPTLEFLRDYSTEGAREYLLGLPGVGPKTAACVLLFALGRPAFPVDTHIHRLAGRLGLVPGRAGPEEVQARLEPLVPPDAALSLHLNLIRHGRRVCRPSAPHCVGCGLSSECRRAAPLPGDR